METIASSPFRVAPEAAKRLDTEIQAKGLTLEFSDDAYLFAELLPSKALIRLGLPFLEVLWAAAHAFIVVFHEYQQASKNREEYFAVGGTPRSAAAYVHYRNVLSSHIRGEPLVWPLDLHPVVHPNEGTDAYVANELFLVAISWIIHHEIAHSRLGHEELTVRPLSEENEADKAATQWVCSGTTELQPLHKRSMGMVVAVLVLISYDLEKGRTRSITHPPSFERLILNLDEIGLGENEMIYAFAFVLVEIHLAHAGIPFTNDSEGSFRDMCVATCMAIRSLRDTSG